jgi:hypothetical protein
VCYNGRKTKWEWGILLPSLSVPPCSPIHPSLSLQSSLPSLPSFPNPFPLLNFLPFFALARLAHFLLASPTSTREGWREGRSRWMERRGGGRKGGRRKRKAHGNEPETTATNSPAATLKVPAEYCGEQGDARRSSASVFPVGHGSCRRESSRRLQ